MKSIVTATITCEIPLNDFVIKHFKEYKNLIYNQLVHRLENYSGDSEWDIIDFEVKQQ